MSTASTKSSGRVTLHEVAQATGVGISTVSNALRGRGRISRDRREEIQRVAREMGYQPQTAAQLMRTKLTGRVAIVIVMPDPLFAIRWTGFGGMMAALVKACQRRGLSYELDFCANGETAENFEAPEHLAGGLADGALILGWLGPKLEQWLDAPPREPWVHMTETSEYCVLANTASEVHMAADHLASLGHRRVALTLGTVKYDVHRVRRVAFEAAARKHGFVYDPERWIYTHEHNAPNEDLGRRMRHALAWGESVLTEAKRPTAMICGSALHARAITEAARRVNLSVPDHLSLTSPGDALNAHRGFPPLSTVSVDLEEHARIALDLLQDRIAGREVEPGTRWVEPSFVVRQSTAPVVQPSGA